MSAQWAGPAAAAPDIPSPIAARLLKPTVRLSGQVDDSMVASFLNQVWPILDTEGDILVELFTSGGDADIGCRIAQEVRMLSMAGHPMWFLGKTLVASAGVTIMSAFPKTHRWLTRDATVLVHGRRVRRTIQLEGPLGSTRRVLEELIADIDNGLRIETEVFRELVAGSNLSLEQIQSRAYGGWHMSASEAVALGLAEGLI